MTFRCIQLAIGHALLLAAGLAFGSDPANLDIYGDPLPEGAALRLGTIRFQSQGGFAWMPDGQAVVTASQGRLWIWSVADGRPITSFLAETGPNHQRYHVAVSSDGSKVLCAHRFGGAISIFDLKAGTCLQRRAAPEGKGEQIVSIALSRDGSTFATGDYQQNLRVWDASTLAPRLRLNLGERVGGKRPCLAYSPDGRCLVAGYGPNIRLFDLDDPANPRLIENAHGEETIGIVFTSDGKRIISAGTTKFEVKHTIAGKRYVARDGQVRVWDAAERRLVQNFPSLGR